VHVDRLVREDGAVLTWFVSYADKAVEVRPELADGLALRDRHGGRFDGHARADASPAPVEIRDEARST